MFLSKSKFIKYQALVIGRTNIENKLFLVEQSLSQATEIFKLEKNQTNINKLHFIQLDTIYKLCSCLEDFFYYHYILRTAEDDIHKKIVEIHTTKAHNEARYFRKGVKINEIRKHFCFPNYSDLPLVKTEVDFLRKIVNRNLHIHKKNLKEMGKFWIDHYYIYCKYRHGCPILTGIFPLDRTLNTTHFYVRIMVNKRRKLISTYRFACNENIFKCYNNMIDLIFKESEIFFKTKLMKLLNPKKLFLPDMLNLTEPETHEFKKITARLQKDFSFIPRIMPQITVARSDFDKYIMISRGDKFFSRNINFQLTKN